MTTKTMTLMLALLAAALAAWLLLAAVRGLLKHPAGREVAVLPVVASQQVRLDNAEPVVLALRGRQFRTGFGQASFGLRDMGRGEAVAARTLVVRSRSSGFDGQVTLSVRRFEPMGAGLFELTVDSLPRDADFGNARLVLLRDNGTALVLRIVAVVAGAIGLVGALVLAALLATGTLRL